MLFNSFSFFLFLSVVLLICLTIQHFPFLQDKFKVTTRNIVLLIASYYFYSFLKLEFSFLLLIVTLINYVSAIYIEKANNNGNKQGSRRWVSFALICSIGILGYFKYFNFFIDSINNALGLLGIAPKMHLLKIILPVGISFFTFQALSYTLDVYRMKIPAQKNFVNVALFISFFPTILSGPIEKARNLLPQIEQLNKITVQALMSGGKLFIWGLFKKIVIADRLAEYINIVYGDPTSHSSLTLVLTAIFYSIQIYADFSGYTDMAIGVGKMMGFNLLQNFNFPYFSSSIREFWKKWHISLTSWFTDYLYISLGGNRVSLGRWIFNISMVFLLSGLWHGANWSFLIWGTLHAIYYLIEHFSRDLRVKALPFISSSIISRSFFKILSTMFVFILVTIAWIFFRIENTAQVFDILNVIINCNSFSFFFGSSTFATVLMLCLLTLFIAMDYFRYKEYKTSTVLNSLGYALLLGMTILFGVNSDGFVYFQF